MSSESVRAMNAAIARQDLQALVERIHPDVEWEHNLGGGSPEELSSGRMVHGASLGASHQEGET
jgi:ketosteroid isomerase-like protein